MRPIDRQRLTPAAAAVLACWSAAAVTAQGPEACGLPPNVRSAQPLGVMEFTVSARRSKTQLALVPAQRR
jgi:hypothetical protein